MTIVLLGGVNNILKATREMKRVYRRDYDTIDDGVIGASDYQFMIERLRTGDKSPVFLPLLDVAMDITATIHFWNDISVFMKEIKWVRKGGSEEAGNTERRISEDDFEGPVPKMLLELIGDYLDNGDREKAQELIPDNFIKRGLCTCDYMTLREIYQDRSHYRHGDWRLLCEFIKDLPYPELLLTKPKSDFWD